jgi:hypothetical protein
MINLFDVQNKIPVPAAVCYMIPEIAAVIKKYPKEYLKALAYIFFTTCPDSMNPYIDLPEDQREEVVIADQQPFKFSLEDTTIAMARDKCRILFETPSLRAFVGAKKALDRVGIYLAETEITDGKDGSAMNIDRFMSKLGEYRKTYKEAESDLREEQAKVRGSLKLRYDFQPGYKNSKED